MEVTAVILLGLLTLAAIVVIALVTVGDAVGRTADSPAQIVIDAHDAIEFCAQALPDDVTATLSYDNLRRVIRFHLEWIQAYHWAPASQDASPIVFEQFDALSYVMERIAISRLEVTETEAAAVIAAHSDYLEVMGAIHIDSGPNLDADVRMLTENRDDTPLLKLEAASNSDDEEAP